MDSDGVDVWCEGLEVLGSLDALYFGIVSWLRTVQVRYSWVLCKGRARQYLGNVSIEKLSGWDKFSERCNTRSRSLRIECRVSKGGTVCRNGALRSKGKVVGYSLYAMRWAVVVSSASLRSIHGTDRVVVNLSRRIGDLNVAARQLEGKRFE